MWYQQLKAFGELRENVALARYTTLGVGGCARWFFTPTSLPEMVQAMPIIPRHMRLLSLGRGSNMLVSDQGFDGVVIDLRTLKELSFTEDGQVQAQAGVRMSVVARRCAEQSLAGLDFMATVPGGVGGGVAMNAGAFGQQVSDTLASISVLQRDGKVLTLKAQQLQMSYRYTVLPPQSIILSACFHLTAASADELKASMLHMRETRAKTQPLSLPNCGSVFKNPDGNFAARLIEQAGLKGKQIGGAQFSLQHANFIVNHGHATCADIMALIACAQQAVMEQFSVALETEVRMI
ncbi:MAG: UDP-N-acetylmuramate dehydrogenase [Mariprofundaceae bacterium]|nr:UDP-N-acetylmuramate dehydrogenase [Mariprofundaceae bacterium]